MLWTFPSIFAQFPGYPAYLRPGHGRLASIFIVFCPSGYYLMSAPGREEPYVIVYYFYCFIWFITKRSYVVKALAVLGSPESTAGLPHLWRRLMYYTSDWANTGYTEAPARGVLSESQEHSRVAGCIFNVGGGEVALSVVYPGVSSSWHFSAWSVIQHNDFGRVFGNNTLIIYPKL